MIRPTHDWQKARERPIKANTLSPSPGAGVSFYGQKHKKSVSYRVIQAGWVKTVQKQLRDFMHV